MFEQLKLKDLQQKNKILMSVYGGTSMFAGFAQIFLGKPLGLALSLIIPSTLDHSNTTFNDLFCKMQNLQNSLIQFAQSSKSIENNSKSVESSTSDFAAIIDHSTQAVDELRTVLQQINENQILVTNYIEDTYEQAISIIK